MARFEGPLDPAVLARRLRYGGPETRQRVAQELLQTDDDRLLDLLTSTVRSSEPWQLRARCLEVLGLAAGAGRWPLAGRILASVTGSVVQAVEAGPDGASRCEPPT